MADLTANAPLRILGEAFMEEWPLDSNAAQTVYKGHPMYTVPGTDPDNLLAFEGADVVAATDVFIGIAAEGATIAAAAVEGSVKVNVYVWPTIVGFKSAVYTNANLGATVYMSDSGTLSATAADNPMIGKLHRVMDGYAFVQIVSPAVCTGA
jgi:hypothetical protein